MRTGFSPRIKDNVWTELRATLKNPDNVPKTVVLRLSPESGFFSAKKTVFEYEVYLPPRCELDYVAPVMSESSDEYRIELYEKGSRISVSDSFLVSRMPGGRQKRNICVISDKDEVSLGSISQLPEYKDKLFINSLGWRNCPQHYALYQSFDALIILRPDFPLYSELQLKAISDYVLRGGKLIFADPQGIISASHTPLGKLLPVHPLWLKQTNKSSALSKKFSQFRAWFERGEYVDFLESVTKEGAKVILSEGESPLFTSIRYGAGNVIATSLPLTEDIFKNSAIWKELISFAYINELDSESWAGTTEILDSLTGLSIPSPTEIRNLLIFIVLPAIIILAVGLFLKKGAIAWLALAIFAILSTFRIFSLASSRVRANKDILLASTETLFIESDSSVFQGNYSLFSQRDTSVDIKADKENRLFSGIPPEPWGFAIMGKFTPEQEQKLNSSAVPIVSEPIETRLTSGIAKIAGLKIRANSSRKFQLLGSSYDSYDLKTPVIEYKQDGVYCEIHKMPISPDEKIEYAGIIFPAGAGRLNISENIKQLDGIMKLDFEHANPVFICALQKELALSRPSLLLLSRDQKSLFLPGENEFSGNSIIAKIIPLREKISGERIYAPYESVIILSADQSTRKFASDPRNFTEYTQDDNEYRFRFKVPEYFAFAKPEKIEVSFKFASDGGNISITPTILLGSSENTQKEKKRQPIVVTRQIHYKEKRGDVFIFSGEELVDAIDYSGCGIVQLNSVVKRKDLAIGQKIRENTWSVRDLKISVSALIPGSQE